MSTQFQVWTLDICLVSFVVFIKPEELKKAKEERSNVVSQKSLTNVSHTHHNHYNFQDNSDEGNYSVLNFTYADSENLCGSVLALEVIGNFRGKLWSTLFKV